MKILIAALILTASAQTIDRRMKIDTVGTCVETAKEFMRANEYSDAAENEALISACRNADPLCVREVGQGLSSSERGEASSFLPIIKACEGLGKGGCYREIVASRPSYEFNEASEAKELLKKCE